MIFGRRVLAILTGLILGLTALSCTKEPAPGVIRLPWRELTLATASPNPPRTAVPGVSQLPGPTVGPGERVALRAAAVCPGLWYLTGSIVAPDDSTRPVVWTSGDGQEWTPMTLAPLTFYGRQDSMYAAACRPGRAGGVEPGGVELGAIGAKSGGAHGNPRVSTWYQRPDGVLTEALAYFELFGGNNAVNVSHIAAGPDGWALSGNRITGAATWVSTDGTEYRLLEGAPGLSNDATLRTRADDIVAIGNRWVMVGAVTPVGDLDVDPTAWSSPDGLTWRRLEVPSTTEYDELQRATVAGGRIVAVGLQGASFGAWRIDAATQSDASGWQQVGKFGHSGGPGRAGVAGLAVVGETIYAATTDDQTYALWRTQDWGATWQEVMLPVAAAAGVGKATVIASDGQQLLVTVDDGRSTRIWLA